MRGDIFVIESNKRKANYIFILFLWMHCNVSADRSKPVHDESKLALNLFKRSSWATKIRNELIVVKIDKFNVLFLISFLIDFEASRKEFEVNQHLRSGTNFES